MAIAYYNTDSIGVGTRISPTSNGSYYIAEGTTIGSTTHNAIEGVDQTNLDFVILGNVFGDDNGISLTQSAGTTINADIAIGQNGSIFGGLDAIRIIGNSAALTGLVQITNEGWIRGHDDGIEIANIYRVVLNNSGLIQTTDISDYAFYSTGYTTSIINSGVMSAVEGGYAIVSGRSLNSIAGGRNDIHNTGEIIGGWSGGAIYSNQRTDTIRNEGVIQGSIQIDVQETEQQGFNDQIINSGSIDGNIFAGGGQDKIFNTGVITGQVFLGVGNGQFLGSTGIVNGSISGGPGDNRIESGIGNDLIEGGDGRDMLFGGAGIDTAFYSNSVAGVRVNLAANRGWGGQARGDWLFEIENLIGSRQDDTLLGDELANKLEGGSGSDTLNGQSGNDRLFGGADEDTLIGGDGHDIFNGGMGRDILWGGEGEDIFEFLDVSESGIGSSRDVIKDFEQDIDLIDLAAMGATSFSAGGFTNTAGEVTYKLIGGGTKTVVEYDHDGDGAADFQILMTNGGFTMTADDFILG